MTAISAPLRATAGPVGPANPFPEFPTSGSARAHVRIPGSARTYEMRDVLRGIGLRWDPVSHAWHGTLAREQGVHLARQYGLRAQIVPTIEVFTHRPAMSVPPAPTQSPTAPRGTRPPMGSPSVRDGRRLRAEARLALPWTDEDASKETEFGTPSRSFSVWDVTSGLPDDSREADERAAARELRDLRGRVSAAMAAVAQTPGLATVLASDWRKAARFYARFGITEAHFRKRVMTPKPASP